MYFKSLKLKKKLIYVTVYKKKVILRGTNESWLFLHLQVM